MENLFVALGYSATAVLTMLVFGYFGKQMFIKLLDTVVEDHKASLARETERLKIQIGVESEVYRLAAQRRFESLLKLWQSSEALFEETDFSNADSIRASLARLDAAVRDVNQNAVLLSDALTGQIREYLQAVGKVLTSSEQDFDAAGKTPEKIALLLKGLSGTLGVLSPTVSMAAAIGAELVPSVGRALERKRRESAIQVRTGLEATLRREFGVWISEQKELPGPPAAAA